MNVKKLVGGVSLATASLVTTAGSVLAQDVNLSLNSNAFPSGAGRRDFGGLFSFFIKLLFALGGILMVIFLIMGGVRYITSGGDKAQAQQAREMITNALIGIIIIGSSYAIATLIKTLFGIDVFNANLSLS